MPGDYKKGTVERVSKRRPGQPKQHAGHPIMRGSNPYDRTPSKSGGGKVTRRTARSGPLR